ncbi:MAG: sodium-dependent transporter [Marinilabiliaceae bacterium]|nr:sodium-dependent transporter [Marinilabiliaceae bacterium]
MEKKSTKRDSFSGQFGIIAAAAGSAIGLGNIWRFPYVLGENGGAAFLLIYLSFVLILGVPLMISEFAIGRSAQKNAIGAFKTIAPDKPWFFIGIMGIGAAFFILSFYAVVSGWTLEYLFLSLKNQFVGKSPTEINDIYTNLTSGTWTSVVVIVIFLALTAIIVSSGIQKGIERYSKILMPMLLIIIVLLSIRSVTLDGASDGLKFLFSPDFGKITGKTMLSALGQSFFSLSLGMGVMITYGSYIKKKETFGKTAISISLTDTLIAVLAGIAIFPAVFAFGIEPGHGPGLVFVTLPSIFNQMAGGYFFSIIFFSLLVIAALTSAISLLEVVVAYFSEEMKIKRKVATWLTTAGMTLLAICCAKYEALFTFFDYTSSNIMLPLGGLLIVIFAGWFWGLKHLRNELEANGKKIYYFKVFVFIIRFIAPIAIALVFLDSLGLISG